MWMANTFRDILFNFGTCMLVESGNVVCGWYSTSVYIYIPKRGGLNGKVCLKLVINSWNLGTVRAGGIGSGGGSGGGRESRVVVLSPSSPSLLATERHIDLMYATAPSLAVLLWRHAHSILITDPLRWSCYVCRAAASRPSVSTIYLIVSAQSALQLIDIYFHWKDMHVSYTLLYAL